MYILQECVTVVAAWNVRNIPTVFLISTADGRTPRLSSTSVPTRSARAGVVWMLPASAIIAGRGCAVRNARHSSGQIVLIKMMLLTWTEQ